MNRVQLRCSRASEATLSRHHIIADCLFGGDSREEGYARLAKHGLYQSQIHRWPSHCILNDSVLLGLPLYIALPEDLCFQGFWARSADSFGVYWSIVPPPTRAIGMSLL